MFCLSYLSNQPGTAVDFQKYLHLNPSALIVAVSNFDIINGNKYRVNDTAIVSAIDRVMANKCIRKEDVSFSIFLTL